MIDPHPSHRAPAVVDDGIPFVGIGDFDDAGKPRFEKARKVDAKVLDEHRLRYSTEDKLVALGRVASIGKVVVLPSGAGPYAVSPTMAILRAREQLVQTSFLPILLQGPEAQSMMQMVARGTTRRSVGMKEIRKLILTIPPLSVQRRIVDLMTHLDAHIANLATGGAVTNGVGGEVHELQALRKTLLGQLLSGQFEIPPSYDVAFIGER